jgi:S-adenosylmethionine decarboxylase
MHLTNPPPNIAPCSGFEGPEKRLEVNFKVNPKRKNGLRAVSKETWQSVLDYAKCTIISCTSNEHFDSFVLSESSLFVYPYKVMIKTCGTTTLLLCLSRMMEVAKEHDTSVELLVYSRKNLNFPSKQLYPHNAWDDEMKFLSKMFDGQGHILGAMNKDHWNLYVADLRPPPIMQRNNQTFEVMMHDLSPQVMSQFFKKEGVTAADTTQSSGIADLLPGSTIDDFQFEPCGYSMNGLLTEWYWTIHITPESHCSYVSFETNAPLASFSRMLKRVFATFQPGRATVAILADDGAPCGDLLSAFDSNVSGFTHYGHTLQTFPNDFSVLSCNFVADVN